MKRKRVTERTQELETARMALERSQAFLNATGQMAKVGGWELDADTLEVRWTEETYRIHEVPLGDTPTLEASVKFFHPDDCPRLRTAIQKALDHGQPYDMEIRFITAKGKHLWVHTMCKPIVVNGRTVKLTGTVQDITERKQAEMLQSEQRRVLELISRGNVSQTEIFEAITEIAEAHFRNVRGSLLLLDDRTIRHGAAPSMPDAYNALIDGLQIGPSIGSCGTAMYRKARVVVTDVRTDPLWVDYRHLGEQYGFRACWSQPILDGNNNVLGTFALYHEESGGPSDVEIRLIESMAHLAKITIERKQMEEARRDNEERLRAIYDQSNDAIFLLDLDRDRIIDFNQAAVRALGYSSQELLNVPISAIHPHDMDRFKNFAQSVYEQGGGTTEELTCRTKSGECIPAELSASYVEIKGKSYLLALVRDITERKRAEGILREMAAFVETNPAPALKLDRQGTIQLVNPAARRLVADEGLMVGKSWFALRPELDRGAFAWLLDNQGVIRHEMRIDNRSFQFTYKGSSDTGFVYLYGADVTELKQAEARLRQVQKMEAIGQLAGGIAHDFNNILTAIFGYSHLIRQALPAHPDLHGYLEQVLTAAERAKDLVEQILTFSRQSEAQRQPLALQTVVTEVLSLLRATLPATIEIRTTIDPAGGTIMADSTELHQVLMNLCTNAEHAMRTHGGVLEIRLCDVTLDASRAALHGVPAGRYAQLHIRDTGSGMSPEVSERIFEPFFTTKPVGEGSGMGLSVVHGIVQRNEGAITVESVLGQGTTFALLFPVIVPQQQQSVVSSTSATLHGAEHILFVDDEPLLVQLYERMVQAYGYSVTTRTSGHEALALFREFPNRFDIVITDQTMPQLTGAQLAQEVLRIRRDMPIILCTGFSATVTPDIAASMGIRDYVMKPIVLPDLLRRIRKIFDNNSQSLP